MGMHSPDSPHPTTATLIVFNVVPPSSCIVLFGLEPAATLLS
jgi:hypothetical protein